MDLLETQLKEFEKLDIPCYREKDFDAFWKGAMKKVDSLPLNVKSRKLDYPIGKMDVRDLTFEGLDGTEISAWLILPPEAKESKVPAIIHCHGAGGSKGEPENYANWILMGVAVIAFDYRLQGGKTGTKSGFSTWSTNEWLAIGILDREDSYIYRMITDSLRAVRLARETKEIDPERIAITGGSQGGGMALAVAAFDDSVRLCMADVPSNCWLEKRVFARSGGGNQIAEFIRRHPECLEQVMKTLSYLDNLNSAGRIKCPVLVSCGLKDPVCPPETAYAVYNKIKSTKKMMAYPFNEHEGGGATHGREKLKFFNHYIK
ncbi:MAG: acetylxylan esterase [Victivallales bacterium]